MLLDIEGTGVEAPLVGHDSGQELSHGEGQQLRDDCWNNDVGVSEEEELRHRNVRVYRTEPGFEDLLD